ncbi:MAG: putative CRISPR-associated protein [Syntrophales bacterium]|nr:putative CRISPR-associated protein [Syntrophales bacterium]
MMTAVNKVIRTIINTVGTSLFSNAARYLGVEIPSEKEMERYLLQADPAKAAAETNAISRLWREGDRLIFLHSHTERGYTCALVLCRHYRRQGIECTLEEVKDLNYQERRFKMRGLRSLVNDVIELILHERRHGREVILNATGGFKAEIAYATLIGLLFDLPVYYIHEAFGDIIEMPPAPVAWDYSLIADYEEFFLWLSQDYRETKEVDARLRGMPPETRLLIVEEEGFSTLSPAGEAFFSAFRYEVEKAASVAVYLSGQAQATLAKLDSVTRRRFEREIEKMRFATLRRSGSDMVRNSDCLVYPKGHRDERIFYYEKEGALWVCEVAHHSDKSYERLIQSGIKKERYINFVPFGGQI